MDLVANPEEKYELYARPMVAHDEDMERKEDIVVYASSMIYMFIIQLRYLMIKCQALKKGTSTTKI